MNISLPPDIERVVVEHAREQGTTPELLVIDSLRERFLLSPPLSTLPEGEGTLADFLGKHIGVLHSSEHIPGGARMSEESGKKFAAGMLKKRQQERLDSAVMP
ncbi:MAG: hypothetical protein HYZ50_04015 [Deltaproteobacteria bacterium]|nr:hypothetical protein [Deltaproteobacteria bacterium]